MNEYIVTWNETVAYRAIVSANSSHEAITVLKDGSQPCDIRSTYTEWDDDSFIATKKDNEVETGWLGDPDCQGEEVGIEGGVAPKATPLKCRCGEEAGKDGLCWQCKEVEDQRQVDRA